MTKRIYTLITLIALTLTLCAQPQPGGKFNAEQFKKEQEDFITKEAHLTPQEASAFFPVFQEMQTKQRELFQKQRECWRKRPQSDKEASQLIVTMDNLDMQMKKMQQQYHQRFCKIIPATKAYACIKAEESFKHKVMERLANRMNMRRDGKGPQRHNKK